MTIERKWTTHIPILGVDIPRRKVLKPGHTEEVQLVYENIGSYMGYTWFRYPARLEVLTPDKIELSPREPHISRGYFEELGSPGSAMELEGERINNFLTGPGEGFMSKEGGWIDWEGKEIKIVWSKSPKQSR